MLTETPVHSNKIPLHQAAEQMGIHSITKVAVKARAKEVRDMGNNELARATKRIFPELEELQEPHPSFPSTSLFLPLMKEVFDSGSMHDQECSVRHAGEIVTIQEKAAPILKRSSFISKVLEHTDNIADGTVSMGRIDLQRFRDADFASVQSSNGTRSADTIINVTARTIRDVLRAYWLEKKMDYGQDFYEVGRYGGDELVVAFFGKTAQLEKEKVMQLVVRQLSMKDGYYRIGDTEWTEVMPILLKKDLATKSAVEWIDFPREENGEKIMYREYLEKGLILNKSDFEREKQKYSTQGVFHFELYRKDHPPSVGALAYPEGITDTKGKVAYLAQHHPELAFYFDLARLYDAEDGSDATHMKRQEILLKLVENSIFDKLLGEMVYSRSHFVEHLGRNELASLQVFDFKYLKEKNDAMTYADADDNIQMLWAKIKDAVPENERNKIIISRFAGAIYVGVRKGSVLSSDSQSRLDKITTLAFDREGTYSVPLGHAFISLEGKEGGDLAPHQILSRLEGESDRAYYQALVRDIQNECTGNSQFVSQMMTIDVNDLKKRDYQPLSKVELYALALRGKRKVARINTLMRCMDEVGGRDFPIYPQLREAFVQELIEDTEDAKRESSMTVEATSRQLNHLVKLATARSTRNR